MATSWRALLGLSWVTLLACGEPEKAAPTLFTEGSRLKAVYQQADGAPPLFLSWYDTKLGVDCLFAEVGLPDRQVCFPTSPVGLGTDLIFARPTSWFADSSCTQPIYWVPAEHGFFISSRSSEDPCATQPQLFSLVKVARDEAGPFRADAGTCRHSTPEETEREAEFLASATLYSLGPEIPLETLVSGTFRPGAGPGRVVPLEIVASDGSVQKAGTIGRVETSANGEAYPGVFPRSVAWDTERQEVVPLPYPFSDTNAHWLPERSDDFGLFADAACSVPAVVGSACSQRSGVVSRERDACGNPAPTVFEPGDPVSGTGQLYYVDSESSVCSTYAGSSPATDGTAKAFTVGAAIPVTAFAAATKVYTGTKQLQLIEAASADGPSVNPLGFWDSVHAQPCSASPFAFAADDSVRCLPNDTLWLSANPIFSDAACSVPLVSLSNWANGCSPTPTLVSRSESMTAPGAVHITNRWHFYALGERYQGPVYDGAVNGFCEDVTARYEGLELYTVGPELPASDFAEVKIVRPD